MQKWQTMQPASSQSTEYTHLCSSRFVIVGGATGRSPSLEYWWRHTAVIYPQAQSKV